MKPVLEVQDLSKTYGGTQSVQVLSGAELRLFPGDTCAILGPSGSGKTTLLSLCAGLDLPTTGRIRLLDQDLSSLPESERSRLRNREVGFVFQSFHLMPSLTALENVLLPLELAGRPDRGEARRLLGEVGLGARLDHYPNQLSGGEQQRVAIARAFINQPKILFADEPTGNLDRETNGKIADLLFDLNRRQGTTLLLITHDENLALRAAKRFRLREGRLVPLDAELADEAGASPRPSAIPDATSAELLSAAP